MSKMFKLRSSILAMSLLAASGFAAAADEAPVGAPPGKHAQHRHVDPVAHAQRNLDGLAKKLNLKDEQKAAWQTYADGAIARAQEKSAKMQAFHSHKGEARADVDTATKLDKMSQAMRDRAVREGEHLGEFAMKALETSIPTPRAGSPCSRSSPPT